ncbi:MAG: hypothetical protein R3A48_24645 [Polyangiales bacterium]
MRSDPLASVLAHLHGGAELTVRNQDGWWGLRGTAEGIVVWSRTPYEADPPERAVSDAEARSMLEGWTLDALRARLTPPLDPASEG